MNKIEQIVLSYPPRAQQCFHKIRDLIYQVARENSLGNIEETLKWGEPAYLIKGGSTLRVDWKAKSPDNLYLFFNCNTVLVETFREVFFDVFEFDGKRAIKLNTNKAVPIEELTQCITVTLRYHKVKHLPLLGF